MVSDLKFPRMAPELIDRAIEEYQKSERKSPLTTPRSKTSLCTSLFPTPSASSSSQSHRSFTLKINGQSLQRFHIILDSPCSTDLLTSIGDLRIVGTSWTIDPETHDLWLSLVPKLSKLISLETLQIEMLTWEDLELHTPASCILRFPKLHVLDISCVKARSFANIFRTVSCCSKLSSLGIVDVLWEGCGYEYGYSPTFRLPSPALRHLTLTRCRKQNVLEWLVAGRRFHADTSLCFEAIRPEECEAVSTYLKALGDSLSTVSLDFDCTRELRWSAASGELVYAVDQSRQLMDAFYSIPCDDTLQSIFISAPSCPYDPAPSSLKSIPFIISSIFSSFVYQLELVFNLSDLVEFDICDWLALDESLLSRRQTGLCRVVFGVKGLASGSGEDEVGAVEWEVRRRLDRSDHEGLEVEVVQWA